MNEAQARVVLGFSHDSPLTDEDVKRNFDLFVRKAHPDLGGDASMAAERIRELKQARDVLRAVLQNAPNPTCFMCRGRGVVVVGPFGATEPCPRCGG